MLFFPDAIMFLNMKNPILKQLEAFSSLSMCVCTQEPLFLN